MVRLFYDLAKLLGNSKLLAASMSLNPRLGLKRRHLGGEFGER